MDYRRLRCIVPVDGFFEWKVIKGQRAKQPYAIAMKDGAPFGAHTAQRREKLEQTSYAIRFAESLGQSDMACT